MVELHGLVDEGLRREAEALLLPVGALVDLVPHDLLHYVLRVRDVDAPGVGVCGVHHRSRGRPVLEAAEDGSHGLLVDLSSPVENERWRLICPVVNYPG